ncbi:MAG: hypothetical protein IJ795_00470 [Bacteroidales bacterium]|nr:hypothetical protein [Bacteroidales bacterium]
MKKLFVISLLLAALSGCSKIADVPGNTPGVPKEPVLVVRGGAIDHESNEPVRGIMVVLFTNKGQVLVRKDTSYTTSEGLFEVLSPGFANDKSYSLLARDMDGMDNGGEYESSVIDINISESSPSFNNQSNSYIVDGNVFYLSRSK